MASLNPEIDILKLRCEILKCNLNEKEIQINRLNEVWEKKRKHDMDYILQYIQKCIYFTFFLSFIIERIIHAFY